MATTKKVRLTAREFIKVAFAFLVIFLSLVEVRAGQKGEYLGVPLPNERASTAQLTVDQNKLVFLPDLTAGNLQDTRVHVVDGSTLSYSATVPSGMVGFFAANALRNELYVATTYLIKGIRGQRTDTVDIYNSRNLDLLAQIDIPTKRAQGVPYSSYLRVSSDGKFLFVQNITPASSVTVVDLVNRKVTGEIETSGCAGIYIPPNGATFYSICGDGALLSIEINDAGQEINRARSELIFDPEADPVYISAAYTDVGILLTSFTGTIYEVDLRAPVAKLLKRWSVTSGLNGHTDWRPGGFEVATYNKQLKQFFVAMHSDGREGSHKAPANEIWRIDAVTHKVIERIPGERAVSLGVTQEKFPSLFALNGETGGLIKFRVTDKTKKVGELSPPLVKGPTTLLMPQ